MLEISKKLKQKQEAIQIYIVDKLLYVPEIKIEVWEAPAHGNAWGLP